MLDLITRFTGVESRKVEHNVTELEFTLSHMAHPISYAEETSL
jgi:hypothetical protein